MLGDWHVATDYVRGKLVYIVCREDEQGKRETSGSFDTDWAAQEYADYKNGNA